MTGRKISREEFEKNYTNIAKSGPEHRRRKKFAIESKAKDRPILDEREEIFNPVYLGYEELKRVTERAYCFRFENSEDHWFPRAYCRVYTRIKVIVVPKVFARERNLLEFEVG